MKPWLFGLALGLAANVGMARADEGMWTFDAFPSEKVQAAYGVTIDKPWLDHLQASAVRLTNGCSASLVSGEGLVMTNNHCVVGCAQNLSTRDADYVANGFFTEVRAEERECPGMQGEVLEQITDLTPQIEAATRGKTGAEYVQARDAALSLAESRGCARMTARRCQVVTLYRGGQFKLYRYHKYDDVRLVFAPEHAIAFFGGDPDNFNFPRYDLDVSFVRLYENGVPAATPTHLRWLKRGPKVGEPVFVAGNPGTTERLLTVAQLKTQRDLTIPVAQLQRSELRGRLLQFSAESPEHARLALDPLFNIENGFKVYYGRQMALNDEKLFTAKRNDEDMLRARFAADPRFKGTPDPWKAIEAAQAAYADNYLRYYELESNAGGPSDLFDYARDLVRAAQERAKPSDDRLPEFADARLPLLRKEVLDPRPIDTDLEVMGLSFWLSKLREYLTADDPATKLVLGKESPEALAARLATGSRLADPAVRKALWEGGLKAVMASDDPMIQFVLKTDPASRDIRRTWEREVAGPIARASQEIARVRFALEGTSNYPDATFTLRLSYGKVDGWTWRGKTIAPTTQIGGLYERATGAPPFALPKSWIDARAKLNPATVMNFVTTNDIIGGNSGSPVVDARGEVLGAAFDGNIHSLGGDYGYDPALNRTVVVSTAAITEALTTIYARTALVQELLAD